MKKLIPISLSLILLLSSCGGREEHSSEKLHVYTSFYAMYDFARAVGGDSIEVTNMVPVGTEPHDFEPTAADMAKLSEADVFIYNGFGMDDWANDAAASLPDTVRIVCASSQLQSEGSDPHVWLSPYCAQEQLQQICDALSEADKNDDNDFKYLEHLTDYSAQINQLATYYKKAGLEGKKLFVTHGAYSYLCRDFGMEQICAEGIGGESDPSPAQIANIVNQIKAENAKCIFYDPLEGSKTADAIAAEAGVEALPLYTFEGDDEQRDYVTIMRFNLEQLKKGI